MPRIKDREVTTSAGPWDKNRGRQGGGWEPTGSTYGLRNKTSDAGLKGGGNSALGIPRPDRVKGYNR